MGGQEEDGLGSDLEEGVEVSAGTPRALTMKERRFSDDACRSEESWSSRNEDLLGGWCKDWEGRRRDHETAAHIFRRRHRFLSLPATLFPLTCGPLIKLWGQEDGSAGDIRVVIAFVLSSVLSGLNTYFRFEVQAERHWFAANRYAEMALDASETLAKKRRYRTDVDVLIQGYKTRYDSLLKSSPQLGTDTGSNIVL